MVVVLHLVLGLRGVRNIGKDGKDLVDWIAAQAWCNGNVGMVGVSYQGFSQYAIAGEKPAALKAIFPEIAGFDDYASGLFYPGGIWNVTMTAIAPAILLGMIKISTNLPRIFRLLQ